MNSNGAEILNDNDQAINEHWKVIEAKKASFRSTAQVFMGLAMTITTAAVGAVLTTGHAIVAPLAVLVVLAFAAQHAFYLWQIRLFRALGNDVCAGRVRMRDMNPAPTARSTPTGPRSAARPSRPFTSSWSSRWS